LMSDSLGAPGGALAATAIPTPTGTTSASVAQTSRTAVTGSSPCADLTAALAPVPVVDWPGGAGEGRESEGKNDSDRAESHGPAFSHGTLVRLRGVAPALSVKS
jgi:hypothetical protein